MASVHIARYVDMDFMFNIASGVGRGRQNQSLDVMLIQYLLSLATDEKVTGPGSTSFSPITPPEYANDPIAKDGIYGTQTQRYIDFYQAFRNSHSQRSDQNKMDINMRVATDGAIDPWKYPAQLNFNGSQSGPALDRTSTLVALCYDAAKNFEIKGQTFATLPDRLKRVLLAH